MQLNTRVPVYKKTKRVELEWNNWRKGYDALLRPTELRADELAEATNIMLIGSGVPTGRWGSSKYFSVNSTGSIRGIGSYVLDNTNEVIALSDEGLLAKKDGATSTAIVGQSYPSGSSFNSTQLGGKTYFVSEDVPLTVYDGTSIEVYATISAPTGVTATNFSGATGSYNYSWRIVALGAGGGVTTGSGPATLDNLPQDLSETQVNLSWVAPSAASLSGFEIYRGYPGKETFLAGVSASVTSYIDKGDPASESIEPPISNTTGGVKSKIIEKFDGRLLVVPEDDPTKLMISAKYPEQYKFGSFDGGGFIYINPDDGEEITGIKAQPNSNKIIVFKNYSSYAVSLDTITVGNYVLLNPQSQVISNLIGCSSSDSVQVVENDIFYFGRKGLYVIGYEPNFLNLIRTNEISSRIRPYLDGLSDTDYKTCCSMYVDNKYVLSFPGRRECIVYDRERGAFLGIWKLPFGINKMLKHVDSSGTERWIIGSADSNQTYTFEKAVNSDDGETIYKSLRTKKEYFGGWDILKTIEKFYILFRNITGEVTANILIEDKNGETSNVKTFTITGAEIAGASGWGIDSWGTAVWGTTAGSTVIEGDELTRWGQLFKTIRLVQVEIVSNKANSNFELLGVKLTAKPQTSGQLTSSQRV